MANTQHDIHLLQCSVDPDDESDFRILVDQQVKYLYIAANTHESIDMCFEPYFISNLPPLPSGDWNTGYISRDSKTNQPRFTRVTKAELPQITQTWHPLRIDYLELQTKAKLRSHMYEVNTPHFSETVVIKFARFYWEIGYLEAETTAYQWLVGQDIGPKFLAHLTEHGRVIGFVMEHIGDSRHATPEDLEICQRSLRKLHQIGIKHGDVNKHNFLIRDGEATLLDFQSAKCCEDKKELDEEFESLAEALADTSGRGGVVIVTEDGEEKVL